MNNGYGLTTLFNSKQKGVSKKKKFFNNVYVREEKLIKIVNGTFLHKMVALTINEQDLKPDVDRISLSSIGVIEAVKELKSKHPDTFNVLFSEISPSKLKLNILSSGYLGTDSYSAEDQILKAFFDNNDVPLSS